MDYNDNMVDNESEFLVFGLNFGYGGSLQRSEIARKGVMISRAPYIIGNHMLCPHVNPPKGFWHIVRVDTPCPYFEWDVLDWAANRIKKALREWVDYKKRRRHFYQSVCGEIRAIPDIGIDYLDKLDKWPKK